jgi:serine/threonine protein kinase
LKSGPLPDADTIDLGLVLADVLDRLHTSGILHRDVKPSNIGYTREGLPKLLDFGLAGLFDPAGHIVAHAALVGGLDAAEAASATLTLTRHLVGTPLYLPPEALRGAVAAPSFDLWSLGVVLYEAIAGTLPLAWLTGEQVLAQLEYVDMPDVREYRPSCPDGVAEFLVKVLNRSVADRPESAAEFRNLLQRLRANLRSTDRSL